MLILWLQFITCSGVIVLCGTNLSKYGDVIAEKTGLGRAWTGLILMASVTSLPELITGISSVTLADVPNIALGDIMGSCVFNLAIIAFMDMLHGPRPIFSEADHGHILSAGFGLILIGISAFSIISGEAIPAIGHVGLYTPLLILIYMLGIRSVYTFEKKKIAEFLTEVVEEQYAGVSKTKAIRMYVLNALFIVAAATFLPFIAGRLADETGLGRSFMGTVFVALTTSLPELAVSISALKIGAADMAIANLFGSNMFNIVILALDDIFYLKGPLLQDVSINHAVSAVTAMLMTGISIVSLIYRLKKKAFMRLGWDAIALLLAFIVNIIMLYALRGDGG